MKFYINKILLWQKDGRLRDIEFKKNKINIITGESGTGKSEIISIIDYCLFSSKIGITEVKINENVNWYGLNFTINDRTYTIARYRIENGKNSNKYYFSSTGTIPSVEEITPNSTEITLKPIIEEQFGVSEKTVFPYGGRKIKLGGKISFRYFLMFNTVSDSIIDNKDYYFDTKNDDKYRDALDRIFDLVMGIVDEEDLSNKEKLQNAQISLNNLIRKENILKKAEEEAKDDIYRLAKQASYLGLLKVDENNTSTNFLEIELHKLLSSKFQLLKQDGENSKRLNKLLVKRNENVKYSKKLQTFLSDYEAYIKLLKNEENSIATANEFAMEFNEVYNIPEAHYMLNVLNYELNNIKENIVETPKVKSEVKKKIRVVEEEIASLNREIVLINNELSTSDNILKEQWMYLGELRTKLKYINFKSKTDSKNEEIERLEEVIKDLNEKLETYPQNKSNILMVLNEIIQEYLYIIKDSLGDYAGYLADFNYVKKTLELRKPKSMHPTKVGSSSNHMFLHLCLFLALQEYLITIESQYVPSWLIFDQPSRPYFGEGELSDTLKNPDTDNAKIKNMLNLLVVFSKKINEELGKDFQIILLEHIPRKFWEEDKDLIDKIHLVEEFRDGNALVITKN